MAVRHVLAASALAVVALAGCGIDDGGPVSETTASDETSAVGPPALGPGPGRAVPVSDAAIDEFADWYEAAVADDGGRLDPSLDQDDEAARRNAYAELISELCGLQSGSPDRLRASAASVADDPEFGGDTGFAQSAILEARTACGLDG